MSQRRKEASDYVDTQLIKSAWLASKDNFSKSLGLTCRHEYHSYQTWWFRRFHLTNYINGMRGETFNMHPPNEEFTKHRAELAGIVISE